MSAPKKKRKRTKAPDPSGKSARPAPALDRRVRRTRDALGDALVALMHEQPFESITVRDVLARAGVARSTFYAHYRDTDDLQMSNAEEFFGHLANALSTRAEESERVFPVCEFFAHVLDARAFVAALVESGRAHDNFELARGHFALGIERRLGELARGRALPPMQRAALSHAHAGALLALLHWWLRREPRESPEEMDELFHRSVWGGPYRRPAGPSRRLGRA